MVMYDIPRYVMHIPSRVDVSLPKSVTVSTTHDTEQRNIIYLYVFSPVVTVWANLVFLIRKKKYEITYSWSPELGYWVSNQQTVALCLFQHLYRPACQTSKCIPHCGRPGDITQGDERNSRVLMERPKSSSFSKPPPPPLPLREKWGAGKKNRRPCY